MPPRCVGLSILRFNLVHKRDATGRLGPVELHPTALCSVDVQPSALKGGVHEVAFG